MINFIERDNRRNDPDFEQTCGSMSVIQHTLRKGLRQLWSYSEKPEDAQFVGVADSFLGFNYPNKANFVILFWDCINSLSIIHHSQYFNYNPNLKVFSINQHTADLCAKMEIPCKVIGPGIDSDFWYQTKPKSDIFTIISSGFSNHRSGIDLLLQAFCNFSQNKSKKVRLILKNTTNNPKFIQIIESLKSLGYNIQLINKRLDFEEMRSLYSESHVSANIYRHSGHGLIIGESQMCNCLSIVGDFDPSNKICGNAIKLKPTKSIKVSDYLQEFDNYGLTNTIKDLAHPEEPLIWDYSIEEYTSLLEDIYSNWSNIYSKIDTRTPILNQWDYKLSARKLIEGLIND